MPPAPNGSGDHAMPASNTRKSRVGSSAAGWARVARQVSRSIVSNASSTKIPLAIAAPLVLQGNVNAVAMADQWRAATTCREELPTSVAPRTSVDIPNPKHGTLQDTGDIAASRAWNAAAVR